jgi:hypothetical protein
MANELTPDERLAGTGRKETVRAGDFDQDTLKEDTEVTIWRKSVNDDQILFHGFGVQNRDFAEGFVGVDLVASGNGTGSAGDDVTGDVVLAITDSEGKRVLRSTTFESLEELRDSLSETRSDRVIEPAMSPYAEPGRNLEIRIEGDANSDGVEIDPDASTGKLYYGLVQN